MYLCKCKLKVIAIHILCCYVGFAYATTKNRLVTESVNCNGDWNMCTVQYGSTCNGKVPSALRKLINLDKFYIFQIPASWKIGRGCCFIYGSNCYELDGLPNPVRTYTDPTQANSHSTPCSRAVGKLMKRANKSQLYCTGGSCGGSSCNSRMVAYQYIYASGLVNPRFENILSSFPDCDGIRNIREVAGTVPPDAGDFTHKYGTGLGFTLWPASSCQWCSAIGGC